jgi:hypothetical protein
MLMEEHTSFSIFSVQGNSVMFSNISEQENQRANMMQDPI